SNSMICPRAATLASSTSAVLQGSPTHCSSQLFEITISARQASPQSSLSYSRMVSIRARRSAMSGLDRSLQGVTSISCLISEASLSVLRVVVILYSPPGQLFASHRVTLFELDCCQHVASSPNGVVSDHGRCERRFGHR